MIITSRENSRLKMLMALENRKGIEKHRSFLVEGLRSVHHALENGGDLLWIVLEENAMARKEIQKIATRQEEKVLILSRELFALLSDTVQSQGIIGICKLPEWDLQTLIKKGGRRFLLMDRIQDPGNAGTLIRTADGAGFHAVLYTSGTVYPYTPKVSRSAMGSNIYLPIVKVQNQDIENLQHRGWQLAAAALDQQSMDYKEAPWQQKVILALGNEGSGLEKELIQQANIKVKIPLYGQAESLNVAAAGAILMYHARENRGREQG